VALIFKMYLRDLKKLFLHTEPAKKISTDG
jgi:hypothetical protein